MIGIGFFIFLGHNVLLCSDTPSRKSQKRKQQNGSDQSLKKDNTTSIEQESLQQEVKQLKHALQSAQNQASFYSDQAERFRMAYAQMRVIAERSATNSYAFLDLARYAMSTEINMFSSWLQYRETNQKLRVRNKELLASNTTLMAQNSVLSSTVSSRKKEAENASKV